MMVERLNNSIAITISPLRAHRVQMYIYEVGYGCIYHFSVMYFAHYMSSYRLPRDMNSYDVGIRHNSSFKHPLLSLHNNNDKHNQFETDLHLNKKGECDYKIYFRNNTTLRCEILIFIHHYDTSEKYLGYPNNHLIVGPDKPYYIGEGYSLEKSYTFVQNYVVDENNIVDLNSYVTLIAYPEIPNMLWHYKFGFKRSNVHYTYKFRLRCMQDIKTNEYTFIRERDCDIRD